MSDLKKDLPVLKNWVEDMVLYLPKNRFWLVRTYVRTYAYISKRGGGLEEGDFLKIKNESEDFEFFFLSFSVGWLSFRVDIQDVSFKWQFLKAYKLVIFINVYLTSVKRKWKLRLAR